MAATLYITHPEVMVDGQIPPTRWRLTEEGRRRAERFGRSPAMAGYRLLITSDEIKAVETAKAIASGNGARVIVGADLHENTRGIGLLEGAEFERRMVALYETPDTLPGGWESGGATAARIVAAVRACLRLHAAEGPLAFVGHGTVGTMLKCMLAGRRPVRGEDQRLMAAPGGGNVFAFDIARFALVADWRSMEDFAAGERLP